MSGSVQGSLKNALAPAANARAAVNVVESLNMSEKCVCCVAKPAHPLARIYTENKSWSNRYAKLREISSATPA